MLKFLKRIIHHAVSNPDLGSEYSDKSDSTESDWSRKLSDVPSKTIIKCRIRYGNQTSACKGLFLDYCRSTTVHGLRYIFSIHRPIYEKIFWIVSTSISFYLAVFLIWRVYFKWYNTPVILGFDETLVPVHKIPFPTITICPETKIEKNLFDFTNVSERFWEEVQKNGVFKNSENFSEDELNYLTSTLHICEEEVVNRFAPIIPKTIRPDITQTLVDLSVSKNETAPFCKWNGHFYFCTEVFRYVATDEGICYQFNGLEPEDIYRNVSYLSYIDPKKPSFSVDVDNQILENITGSWSLEEGYVGQGFNSYPQRTVISTAKRGFFTLLQALQHNYEYTCNNFQQGYKVFFNSPESVAMTTGNYILVPYGHEVLVSVLPEYTIGDKNLREYPIQKRHCFFNDERYLQFFKYYSQANCQTECLANFTIAKCGCAKFWMPKPHEIPVCGVTEIDCYTNVQEELSLLLQKQSFKRTHDPNSELLCNCLPSCTSLEYNAEISNAFFDFEKGINAFRETYEHDDYIGSRLSVYFKEHQFTAIKRSVLYTYTSLIANFGGMLGLFLGFSSLSLFELIYFFTLRLYYNIRKRHLAKKKWMEHEN